MVQLTLRIDGMSCGMCESHVNDTIRQKFNVKRLHLLIKRERQ